MPKNWNVIFSPKFSLKLVIFSRASNITIKNKKIIYIKSEYINKMNLCVCVVVDFYVDVDADADAEV